MYDWRKMSPAEREEIVRARKEQGRPKHSPAHRASERSDRYHITAACYEHQSFIGEAEGRLAEFSAELLATVE